MIKVYNQLLEVIDEAEMSKAGHYLSCYEEMTHLEDDVESENFNQWFEEKFNVSTDDVTNAFITFDSADSNDGYIYTDADTSFDNIIGFLSTESRYRKYVDNDKVEKIRGY